MDSWNVNGDGGIVVKDQVSVPISMGNYFEDVLFDDGNWSYYTW